MYEAAQYYDLLNKINTCMQASDFGTICQWKTLVKRIVWENEILKWRATCNMYKELKNVL